MSPPSPSPPVHPRRPEGASDSAPPADERWWRRLGPGLISGAADDDPRGIATYLQVGTQLGYAVGWVFLVTWPLMVAIQIDSARLGRTTGTGLTAALMRVWPRPWVATAVLLLVVANTANLTANLGAMADVAHTALGGGRGLWLAAFGLGSLVLQVWMPYARYVRVLKWLTLSLFSYAVVALVAGVDWRAAARGLLLPTLSLGADGVRLLVAVLGTTISPSLFFWQAAQEVEEIGRQRQDLPLDRAPEQAPRELGRLHGDTWVGMGVANVIALSVVFAAAATLHTQGQAHIATTTEAAQALKPVAGDAAFALFALGIVGTGLIALPVLAGSTAYACADLLRVPAGLDHSPRRARLFYVALAVAMASAIGFNALGIHTMDALVWAAVLNAVLAVPIMVGVMRAASAPQLMGRFVLPRVWQWVGWTATAAMAVACVAWVAVSWFTG